MREIKFRAWDFISKEMRYLHAECSAYKYYELFCNTPDNLPIELMQYTGLHDMTGRELYEGDYVAYETEPGKIHEGTIVWAKKAAAFRIDEKGALQHQHRKVAQINLTYTGNIFENPDLLEGR